LWKCNQGNKNGDDEKNSPQQDVPPKLCGRWALPSPTAWNVTAVTCVKQVVVADRMLWGVNTMGGLRETDTGPDRGQARSLYEERR
jgi:hypothetical protein